MTKAFVKNDRDGGLSNVSTDTEEERGLSPLLS